MNIRFINSRSLTLMGMILIAALSRLIYHIPNVTPLTAVALFGGFYFTQGLAAFFVPLAGLFLSDLFIGFHSQMLTVYSSFILITAIGLILRKRHAKLSAIPLTTVACSLLFFLVTNFGVWLWDGLYPKTLSGLWACYIAGIPFLKSSVLGDLFYVALLFIPFALAEKNYPSLQEPARQIVTS